MIDRMAGIVPWVAAFALTGCAGIGLQNVEEAVADLEQAITHFEEGIAVVQNDPKLAEASKDFLLAYGDVLAAKHDLLGGLSDEGESCQFKCVTKCPTDHLANCLANCPKCSSHCCGCWNPGNSKDGCDPEWCPYCPGDDCPEAEAEAILESCESKCKHQCGALEVPSCVAGCIVGEGAHCN